MTEAQQTVALHRTTGQPLLLCRAAIRSAPDDGDAQLEFLRERYDERMAREHPGCMWRYPPGLRIHERR